MKTHHPRKDHKGRLVPIDRPHQPSNLETWSRADQHATVTPDSPMPAKVAGLSIASWSHVPASNAGWEELAQLEAFDEPARKVVHGKPPASGAVVVEVDDRVWVVSPSNSFGGYSNTFPKGKVDAGLSPRANALKECFEESGLQVELTGFLCDSERSTSVTRYYLARRVGGNPADMGWESQAVHLVPISQLTKFASHTNDQGILEALNTKLAG